MHNTHLLKLRSSASYLLAVIAALVLFHVRARADAVADDSQLDWYDLAKWELQGRVAERVRELSRDGNGQWRWGSVTQPRANDLGFMRKANVFEPHSHEILENSHDAESDAFKRFVASATHWEELSDFSYAGYHYGEVPIEVPESRHIPVAEFGAIPDDDESDRDAIQAAFDRAGELGGGIVLFDHGVYDLDALSGETAPLQLRVGNTVLLGQGSGPGRSGTTLRMRRHLEPLDPGKMYSTPFILNVGELVKFERPLTRIKRGANRGSFQLEVEDPSVLNEGMWVTLFLRNRNAVQAYFGERQVSDLWKRLHEDGTMVRERHQILRIRGNTVTFREPLQIDVDESFSWKVLEYEAIEEVGIEAIRFLGGWKEDFVHHKDAFHDGGWSCLNLFNVRNSWIRDVAFEDWNYALKLENCSATSILRVNLSGTPGHHGIHVRSGYGNLIGLICDTAEHFHSIGVGYHSAATVYWRYEGSPGSSFDAHSTGPYATLLDACIGGWRYGRSGGPLAGMPNHMRYLTVWNFERTGGDEPKFDFWREDPDARDRFLDPLFIGFHGLPTGFNQATVGLMESLGKAVQPESLYEAQLALRLGQFPQFLQREIELWKIRQAASRQNCRP